MLDLFHETILEWPNGSFMVLMIVFYFWLAVLIWARIGWQFIKSEELSKWISVSRAVSRLKRQSVVHS